MSRLSNQVTASFFRFLSTLRFMLVVSPIDLTSYYIICKYLYNVNTVACHKYANADFSNALIAILGTFPTLLDLILGFIQTSLRTFNEPLEIKEAQRFAL